MKECKRNWCRTGHIETPDGDEVWEASVKALQKKLGFGPLTLEEAAKAYEEGTPVPLTEERIREIVEYATGGE